MHTTAFYPGIARAIKPNHGTRYSKAKHTSNKNSPFVVRQTQYYPSTAERSVLRYDVLLLAALTSSAIRFPE
jgi:hypothetical protein